MQEDQENLEWGEALEWAENLDYVGCSDWRLPDTKELQSIVDFSKSPDTTNSPAIDPLFKCTEIKNEAGEKDYGFYWSSTIHAKSNKNNIGTVAAYVSFGRSLGNLSNTNMPDISGKNGTSS